MSIPNISNSINGFAEKPTKQLESIESNNFGSKFRIAVRVLSVTNRFLKARNARETNLIALAQGHYQKNCNPIRVYYANRKKVGSGKRVRLAV